jgi:ABC-2 type transport system permease protein
LTSPAIAAPRPEGARQTVLFLRRLWGLALRHIYLHIGSWPRILEMLYWPIVNMATWGFVSLYLIRKFAETDATIVSAALMAGVLLNEIFLRVIFNMLMLFLEEIWSRNLGHLFATPLKVSEYVLGLILSCLVRTTLALTPAIILARFLFGFSLFHLGAPLAAFIPLLALNGCWYGLLIVALLLRYGLAAEWLAWMSTWLFVPLVAPYYPVSILPEWMQTISYMLPATYVFESMKALIGQHELHAAYLWKALGLNIVYFVLASFVFYRAYRGARARGGLLQMGE